MHKTIIGIQGGKGSFNEEAFYFYIKENKLDISYYELRFLYTSENVLSALDKKEIDIAQFAVHNSIGGVVIESMIAMGKYNFKFIDSFRIKISHCLMVKKGTVLSQIEKIMTHPQVLKQCSIKLSSPRYSNILKTSGEGELIDHANIALKISSEDLPSSIATMGSRVLSQIYDLEILEENMQNSDENYTTFVWVEN